MRFRTRIIAGLLLAASASAASATDRHRLDLPSGRLGDAIVALGRQAGITIGLSDPALANQRVGNVRGTLTVEQALRRMLRGTEATYVAIDPGSWRIARKAAIIWHGGPPRRQAAPRTRSLVIPAALPLDEEEQQEIVVTASKRDLRLRDYAGSVSLLSGAALSFGGETRGTEAVTGRLATLSSTHLGPGRNKLFIRGVADSSFTGPTQATVGQYFGDVRLNYNAPDPDLRLYDIDRVEVLEGPQGTLYGAGSLGGIIRVVRAAPRMNAFEGAAAIGVSTTAHGQESGDFHAIVNVPLLEDRIALRAVAYGARDGGYIDDVGRALEDVNDVRTGGARIALRAEPGEEWTIELGAALQDIDGDDSQYSENRGDRLSRSSALAQGFENRYFLADMAVSKSWGSLRFSSASGFVRHRIEERFDATRPGEDPRAFDQRNRISFFSTENRLSRDSDGGISWVVGTSFIRNRSTIERTLGSAQRLMPSPGVRNRIDELTFFGETTIPLLRGVEATLGGRYTRAELSGDALSVEPALVTAALLQAQAKRVENSFLPSLALTARPLDGVTLFARYQEGFRPGGLAVFGPVVQRYRNDSVKTIEAGVRLTGSGAVGAYDLSATVAHTSWSNIQADIVDPDGFPVTTNIGNGRIFSLDAKAAWRPIAALGLEAGLFISDSDVDIVQHLLAAARLGGLPNVAGVGGRGAVDFETPVTDSLDLNLAASARYVGHSRLGTDPLFAAPQGNYFDTSLIARVGTARMGVTLGLTNLLDSTGNRFALGNPFTMVREYQITPLRPRTIRLGFETLF